MSSYFKKAEHLLVSPHKFFASIKKERGFSGPFKFYTITVILTSFLYALYPSSLFLDLVNKLGISKFSYYWIILFSTSFISGFITAFLIHLFLKIIGGKGTYADTYKIYAYSALILSLNVVSQFLFSFPAFQMVISLSLIVWFILVLKNGLRVVHW